MVDREYIILSDESDKAGPHYCNFYGGVLVGSSQYETIVQRLNEVKASNNLYQELKWKKVTSTYLPKYVDFITAFFDEVRANRLKIRIFFRQTAVKPTQLSTEQIGSSYFRLYYQFIKHGFGLQFSPRQPNGTWLRLYFDQLPDTGEQVRQFKGYIKGLEKSKGIHEAGIRIRKDDIAEVKSHDHVLLQGLDVVLGAMAFRLNDKHKQKPPGQYRRGKRTVAKEKLYKSILSEIRTIHKNFNVGISTGDRGNPVNRWLDPYRHWSFKPHSHEYLEENTKAWKRKNPT